MNTSTFPEYYLVRLSPDGKTITAFVNAPFFDRLYWQARKETLVESFIQRIEKHSIPNLSRHVVFKEAATPHTLHRYTSNFQGSAYGWAGTPSQFADSDFRNPPFVKGLHLTGHWTTFAQGIPGVAYLGYDTARTILRQKAGN
jgi:phytoene dehydrogenase-like protein